MKSSVERFALLSVLVFETIHARTHNDECTFTHSSIYTLSYTHSFLYIHRCCDTRWPTFMLTSFLSHTLRSIARSLTCSAFTIRRHSIVRSFLHLFLPFISFVTVATASIRLSFIVLHFSFHSVSFQSISFAFFIHFTFHTVPLFVFVSYKNVDVESLPIGTRNEIRNAPFTDRPFKFNFLALLSAGNQKC